MYFFIVILLFFFLTVRNNYYIFELEYTIFKQRMILFKETVKKVVNTEKVISLRTILFFSDIPKFFIWAQTVSTVKGNKKFKLVRISGIIYLKVGPP